MAPIEVSRGRELLIFPCNGNGLEALDCLGSAWHCLGFVDDTPEKQETGAYGHAVMGRAALTDYASADVLAVHRAAPNAMLIASHMEAVNHCILSRADLRAFSKRDGYEQRLLIPADGETLAI